MSNIIKQNKHWFIDNDGELVHLSPSNPMFDSIWEGVSKMLDVYEDDCGANLDRCVQFCNEASKLFAGISELAAGKAVDYQKQIEFNELYAYDPNEPYWNR